MNPLKNFELPTYRHDRRCMQLRNWSRHVAVAALLAIVFAGCRQRASYPDRPVTLICPWGIGGGTDQIARQIAIHLEQELGQPVNVINETGGQGVNGHQRGMRAPADGYTLAMITVELNMLHWYGLTDLTFRDGELLASMNEDSAALLVHRDAPWQSLAELTEDVRRRPGAIRASGTANGGIWHLAAIGWLRTFEQPPEALTWVASQGAGPALQDILPDSLVFCSLPEARILLKEGRVRCLGVMASERIAAFPDVPTFQEQGASWSLGGWRGLALPDGTPPAVVDRMSAALDRVFAGQTAVNGKTFPDFLAMSGFNFTVRRRADFARFLAEQDASLGRLIGDDMAHVARGRFHPYLFPGLMAALLCASLTVIVVRGRRLGVAEDAARLAAELRVGWTSLAFIPVIVAGYVVVSPWLGFLATTAALVGLSAWRFGAGARASVLLGLTVAPIVYQAFAHGLRVPLPRVWLEW